MEDRSRSSSNHFQDLLLQHYAFFNYAKHYMVNHHPTKSFEVDDVTMQDFRKFLDSEKIPFTEAELLQNNDWVRSSIKSEIFVNAFGQEEGLESKKRRPTLKFSRPSTFCRKPSNSPRTPKRS